MADPHGSDFSESDVYVYLIQAAIWHALFIPRQAPLATPPILSPASSSGATRDGPVALTATKRKMAHRGIASLSEVLASAASSSGGKEAKYPERLIKRLGDRIAAIANGTDATYRDPAFRSTMAVFAARYSTKEFQRGLKESRRIEDLILHFTTQAQGHLASQAAQGTEWKEQLDGQVRLFVHLLRDTVAARSGARDYVGSSSKELLARLDSYAAQMDRPAPVRSHNSSGSLSHVLSPTSPPTPTKAKTSISSSSVLTMPASELVEEQPVFLTVARLMEIDYAQLLKDIDTIRFSCTQKAVLADLKHTSANVNLGNVWPGRKTDFENDEAWKTWKAGELDYLSRRIAAMCMSNPELLRTSSDPAPGNHSIDAADTSHAPGLPAGELVFVPHHPVRLYRRVIRMCFDRDLDTIASSADDEGVELTILSSDHAELLKQVAEVWRVRTPFTCLTHLQLVLDQLEQVDSPITIPVDCVEAVLKRVERAMEEEPISLWMTREQHLLHETLFRALERALTELANQLQELRSTDLDELYRWTELADHIHIDLLHRSPESQNVLETRLDDLKDLVHVQAIHQYTAQATETLGSAQEGQVVAGLHQLCTWLTKRVRKLPKQFPQSLLWGCLDVASLVVEKQVPLFWDEMMQRRPEVVDLALRDQGAIPFDDLFQLYDDVAELRKAFARVCPDVPWGLDVGYWFQPHVEHWLVRTSDKTAEWVDNAVRVDTFEPIDSVGAFHSSSIDDLFTALQQPLDFLDGLNWPDERSLALFKTSLAKTFSRAIEQYCARIEDMFMTELLARPAGAGTAEAQKQHHAWVARAKQTLRGESKIEPFALQPATCVKLNNIQKARQLLDTLYNKMDADAQSSILALHTSKRGELNSPAISEPSENRQRHLFTVKVVQADGLRAAGGGPGVNSPLDSFVTLTNESTHTQYARTRTAYETCEPRWDESFDIAVEDPVWLTLTVMERRMGAGEVACGRTVIKLDPTVFQELKTQSLVLELDTQGKLHLRISVEMEQEDILYHFGRAFRSLKRCESDMIRTVVDKIAVFIRQCLSRSTVKSLVRTHTPMGKSLGMVKTFATSAWAATTSATSDSLIPPVEAASARARTKGTELTDAEIEQAIAPLLDYFDSVLATLNENLSPEERLTVLSKVWKQVLVTLQGILLPPLSDEPSDMRPLTDRHIAVVMKWRLFLFTYFLSRDEETNEVHGLPVDVLQTAKFRELDEFVVLNDLSTDELMLECSRAMQRSLQKQAGAQGVERSKSVINQRSLGTIKKRKAQKKVLDDFSTEDLILRILRMRSGTQEFISQQLAMKSGATSALALAKPSRTSRLMGRKLNGRGHQLTSSLPQVPSLPTIFSSRPSLSSPLVPSNGGPPPRAGPVSGDPNAPAGRSRAGSLGSSPPLPPRAGANGRPLAAPGGARAAPSVPPPLPPR